MDTTTFRIRFDQPGVAQGRDRVFLGGDAVDLNDLFKRLGIEQRGPREFILLPVSGETATLRAKCSPHDNGSRTGRTES